MILSDRTRYITGTQGCQFKRYLNFHHNGRGIVPKGSSIDLWTGNAYHKCLEYIYLAAKLTQSMPSRIALRAAISAALRELRAQALASGSFLYEPNFEWRLSEQLALAEGLAWGYCRAILPKILAEYTIEYAEQEMPLDYEDVRLQTRPDLVLRSRNDQTLSVHDFKGTQSISDAFVAEFITSPQMASCAMAAERYLGEPVRTYTIHALLKGSRKPFTKKGQPPTEKRQYSIFCYGRFKAGNPPLTEQGVELGGYWYDKQPTWQMPIAREPQQSPLEAYVDLLPIEALWEEFALVGPYPVNKHLGMMFLKSLALEEYGWRNNLEQLEKLGSGTLAGEVQSAEDFFTRSFKCHDYGSKCSYFSICFEGASTENGNFEPRTPHHEEERLELDAQG